MGTFCSGIVVIFSYDSDSKDSTSFFICTFCGKFCGVCFYGDVFGGVFSGGEFCGVCFYGDVFGGFCFYGDVFRRVFSSPFLLLVCPRTASRSPWASSSASSRLHMGTFGSPPPRRSNGSSTSTPPSPRPGTPAPWTAARWAATATPQPRPPPPAGTFRARRPRPPPGFGAAARSENFAVFRTPPHPPFACRAPPRRRRRVAVLLVIVVASNIWREKKLRNSSERVSF